ncbi:MAG: GNAT family N-acetyltransferase [Phocaeicola sp.]|uniref:GNAT family N-acetyltransferase n=1 Tax=Phocaeicola TaxID=909656 RepID=UPI00234EE831|nr:GNAT family N-acetyltransferase [Phocaeicola oris]MCE2617161.1 GNAT family N-acetyltransferase [Phocaeicola oris]
MNIRPITTADEIYQFVEDLLVEAFPANERRDLSLQRNNTDYEPLFCCNVLEDDKKAIGLLNFWEFPDIYYIEHFAISKQIRNRSYGTKIIETLLNKIKKPIIIEVERPDDELAKRRINFYLRAGFKLDHHDYMQPPYRPTDKAYPMYIMNYGDIDMEQNYEKIKNTLYKEVYGMV